MDEKVIYIIFIILWILYSVFGKKKKPQNRQVKPIERRSAAGGEAAGRERGENIKTIIEKMLLGEEFSEKAMTSQEAKAEEAAIESFEAIEGREEDYVLNEGNLTEINSVETKQATAEAEIPVAETASGTVFKKIPINLRQAMIHSVILNKPYN
jgi:hypothetical protein